MAKLFVIRKRDAAQLRLAESLEGSSVLLLQDGIYLANEAKTRVYASAEDARKRGVELGCANPVTYAEIVTLLLEEGNTVINL